MHGFSYLKLSCLDLGLGPGLGHVFVPINNDFIDWARTERLEWSSVARLAVHCLAAPPSLWPTRAGLDEHFKLFHEGAWAGGEEFGALMGTGKVSFAGAGYGETLVSVANDEFALE